MPQADPLAIAPSDGGKMAKDPAKPGRTGRNAARQRGRQKPVTHVGERSPTPPAGAQPRIADSRSGRNASSDRGGWNARRAYAAIDLGTNNCRLLIAKPAADGFVVVDAFSRVVRLGEGLGQSGRLSDAAMDRAVAALSICADKLRRRHVALARSVATEACRKASNGPAFIERVRRETGIVLDIITAEEEARLAVLGCHILLEPGDGPALIFDIGGGSTELVLVDSSGPVPDILDWMSVPWGVVTLTESERFDHDDPEARAAAYTRMRERVMEGFAPFARRLPCLPDAERRLLGTSGTVTTLASLHLDLPCYNRDAIDGLIVPSESMRSISARLAGMSLNQRRELPCIGKERADLVVAGCAILESILDIWPAMRLGVADRGIREGILRALMGRDAPHPNRAAHEQRA
ncbi:Ppx/GppA phosphatase family protein [Blastomonas sp. UPD001]|jgi:exopolyphosphatase / guanosine-5'-triphosphate,3'-diphosphate pyrophosphatase|uniref:Ppx/GppA phosphatase family protein n=1 Tax=Blastomonas sp. UPD001 TaxID=2217673 RepID=UPI001E64CB05|nr:Ppx/GppA phosphatase family protein [Blastomonas sp. UPD001]